MGSETSCLEPPACSYAGIQRRRWWRRQATGECVYTYVPCQKPVRVASGKLGTSKGKLAKPIKGQTSLGSCKDDLASSSSSSEIVWNRPKRQRTHSPIHQLRTGWWNLIFKCRWYGSDTQNATSFWAPAGKKGGFFRFHPFCIDQEK